MKRIYTHLKSEDGNTMIEATFVVTITLVVLTVIMMLGFIFYQESHLQSAANLTAIQVARTYPDRRKDPVTGFIEEGELGEKGIFEGMYYLIGEGSGRVDEAKGVGRELAKKNLERGRVLLSHTVTEPEIKIAKSSSAMFQNEVIVTIEESYYIPFAGLLGVEDGLLKRKYVGKAQCVDVLGAQSYNKFFDVLCGNLASQKSVSLVKDTVETFKNFVEAKDNLSNFLFGGGEE